jgi:hypothetical protein
MAHCGNVPWHDHEPQVRVTRCRGGEGIEIKLLLGSLRAAGEEDENVVAEARERPQSRHLRGQSIPFTPSKALADAQHIAYAAIAGVDYVLTWNCRISRMRSDCRESTQPCGRKACRRR